MQYKIWVEYLITANKSVDHVPACVSAHFARPPRHGRGVRNARCYSINIIIFITPRCGADTVCTVWCCVLYASEYREIRVPQNEPHASVWMLLALVLHVISAMAVIGCVGAVASAGNRGDC